MPAKPLSPTQRAVLEKLAAGHQLFQFRPGGVWNIGPASAVKTVSITTVLALRDAGLIFFLKDGGHLTPAGLSALAPSTTKGGSK